MWNPQYRRDVDLLECIQRRAADMIQRVEYLSFKERLKELQLFSLEKRRLHGGILDSGLSVSKDGGKGCLKGCYKKEGDRLFNRVCCDRIGGNGFRMKKGRFRLDITKYFFCCFVFGFFVCLFLFFMIRVVKH